MPPGDPLPRPRRSSPEHPVPVPAAPQLQGSWVPEVPVAGRRADAAVQRPGDPRGRRRDPHHRGRARRDHPEHGRAARLRLGRGQCLEPYHRRMLARFARVWHWGDPDAAGSELTNKVTRALPGAKAVRLRDGDVTETYLLHGKQGLLDLISTEGVN